MNESSQKRQIQRFLTGHDKRDIDAFCIYQWIERCHIQKWWGLAIELSPYIKPGTLQTDYQKRLDFILRDCRNNEDKQHGDRRDQQESSLTARRPVRKIIRGPGSPSGSNPFSTIQFDNDAKQTLREIYSVLYYMQKNNDFVDAVRHTKDNFNITYQAVDDKCARRFAGTVDVFQRWYVTGEVLQKLRNHFHLSHHDYEIFEEMLTKKLSR